MKINENVAGIGQYLNLFLKLSALIQGEMF